MADIAVVYSGGVRVSAYPWNEGSGFGVKYSDPASPPTGGAEGVVFSRFLSNTIAIVTNADGSSPYIFVYPWSSGSGFGAKYSDPGTPPPDWATDVAFSPSGDTIAVAHWTSPRVSVYPWSAGFGSKYSDPGTLPASTGYGVAFSPSGNDIAVAHANNPYLSVYPWSSGFGSKYSDPGTKPTGTARGVKFSNSGADLAVAHYTDPFLSVYPWSAGFGSKYANPGTKPAGLGIDVAFSPSDSDIVVSHVTSPYVSAYPWSSGFGTKYSDPGTAIVGNGYAVGFSPNGVDIAVSHASSPYVSAYPWSSGFGTKYADPGTAVPNSGYGMAFSSESTEALSGAKATATAAGIAGSRLESSKIINGTTATATAAGIAGRFPILPPSGLVVAWPSTAASIPAGWSRYAALDEKVPKAGTHGAAGGGSDTHLHTVAAHSHNDSHYHIGTIGDVDTWEWATANDTGVVVAAYLHSHYMYSSQSFYTYAANGIPTGGSTPGNSNSGTNLGLPRYSVIWIQSDGTTHIPVGAVLWSTLGSVPANFRAADGTGGSPNLTNRYLRGAAAGADGGTDTVAASHNHTYSHNHPSSTASHAHAPWTSTGNSGATEWLNTGAGATVYSAMSSSHTLSGTSASATHDSSNTGSSNGTSDSDTPDVAYHKLQHIQVTTAAEVPHGVVALYPSASEPAANWKFCDGTDTTPNLNGLGKYVKGANGVGEIGSTGGSNTHSHVGSHYHSVPSGGSHGVGSIVTGAGHAATVNGSTGAEFPGYRQDHGHATGDLGGRVGDTDSQNQTYYSVDHQPSYVVVPFLMRVAIDASIAGAVATAPAAGVAGDWYGTVYVNVAGETASATAAGIGGRVLEIFIPTEEPVVAPTEEEIADALAGCHGPVVIRHRFEWWDENLSMVADISSAVVSASVSLDNNRAIVRTCRAVIKPDILPGDFDPSHDLLAVFAEVLVVGQWVRYPMGVFLLDLIHDVIEPNQQITWEAQGVDLVSRLVESEYSDTVMLPAGSNYVETVEALCQGVGLPTDFQASPLTTPVAFVWPPGTSRWKICDELMRGIAYYPVWAKANGMIRSRAWVDPYLENIAVTYTTEEVPRMIRPDFVRNRERGRFVNRAVVSIRSTSRDPLMVQVTNDDTDSIVSTVNKSSVTSQNVSADRVANGTIMLQLGAMVVKDAAVKAQSAKLSTHPDPRRDAHEYYTIRIDDREVETKWRAESWQYQCKTGDTMNHNIGRANRVDVSYELVVVAGSGEATIEPTPPPPEAPPPPGEGGGRDPV